MNDQYTVLSDLNIVCLGQRNRERISTEHIFVDIAQRLKIDGSYYRNSKFLNAFKGVWYQFSPMLHCWDAGYQGDFFTIKKNNEECFSISSLNKKQLYVDKCNELFVDEIKEIINKLIQFSPIKEVVIMIGIEEDDESETVVGVLKISEFWKLLLSGKILFNVAYLVKADDC